MARVQSADHDVLAGRGAEAVEEFLVALGRHRVEHAVRGGACLVLREQVHGRGVAQPVDQEPRALSRRPAFVERRPDGRDGPLREHEPIRRTHL